MIDPISLGLQASAVATTWAGSWLIGNKSLLGPALAIVSCVLLIIINVNASLWLLIPMCGVSALLNVRTFVKWKRET